jgi:hypothetical protein
MGQFVRSLASIIQNLSRVAGVLIRVVWLD